MDGLRRTIFEALRRQGWRLVEGRHLKAIPPDPTLPIVVTGRTPSDGRQLDKWVSQLRRSGFRWPEA